MHLCNVINVGTNSYVARNVYVADCSDEMKLFLSVLFPTLSTLIKIVDFKLRLKGEIL